MAFFKTNAGKLRWRRGRLILTVLVAGALLLAIYAFLIEPSRLVVRETQIALPCWPAELKGLRIVAMSDLHVGAPWITLDKLRQVVATANATQPDLIVLAGDFVIQDVLGGDFIAPEQFAPALKELRARYGVFAVLGNHDWWYSAPRVKQALATAGILVIENQAVKITAAGKHFWLAGLADLWEGRPDIVATLEQITDDAPVMAVTHNPDLFPQLPTRICLTIAGHTHGGQVAFPVLGRLIVPSQWGERYALGHIVEDNKHLFVTPGVGTSILPVRFRVPPEISLLTIN